MAADQDRADRIRALKQERPDLTWRRIADYVGVTERSATDWQKKGGIEYENAKKLAELFGVDPEYIWRGEGAGVPSPFAGQDHIADRLDRIETELAALTAVVREAFIGRTAQGEAIIARLDGLESAVLKETRAFNDEPTERLRRLGHAVVTGELPEEDAQDPRPARARRRGAAKKRAAESRTP